MADDLGYGDVGAYGQVMIQTPNIDRLSREEYNSVIFTQVPRFVLQPLGSDDRFTYRTHVFGATLEKEGSLDWRKEGRVPLRDEDLTIAEVLQDKGYRTGMVGKWGLGEPNTTGEPYKKGFDYFYGFYNQRRAHSYYPEYLWENTHKVMLFGNEKEQNHQYTHSLFADKAINFIDRNHQTPFFLYLPVCIPHSRYELPDNGIYNQKRWTKLQKIYAAMITVLTKQ